MIYILLLWTVLLSAALTYLYLVVSEVRTLARNDNKDIDNIVNLTVEHDAQLDSLRQDVETLYSTSKEAPTPGKQSVPV